MITENYSQFFKALAKNNHKSWFHENKKKYEQEVKAPFLQLLEALIPVLRDWDDRILPDPKKALFRINRDVRFSKDKSPYNLIMKAGFSPNGKKSVFPGYYLGIDADSIHVGGGLFMLQPADLKKVRAEIAENSDRFLQIVEATSFKERLGDLLGENSKRLDKDLMPAAEKNPLIYKKQFYAMASLPLEAHYGSEKLPEIILSHFREIKPLNDFLNNALI
ncbi:DUF2461 domain-containing protein [Poritiphilus flavus]|uniref:TIGR02453 family protein n=1 Tax=Poritiphilus flavus TaxID=2697053 RepID=A0A6L9E8D0_9FLAO|nr:DUF2461 domain-containing protein [Poritiphilus flavus]NAS10950.1 TIGR02453 family protein [Poritiphilus flavus]